MSIVQNATITVQEKHLTLGRKTTSKIKGALRVLVRYIKWYKHLLLYSSLNPAADTLISEKKWR